MIVEQHLAEARNRIRRIGIHGPVVVFKERPVFVDDAGARMGDHKGVIALERRYARGKESRIVQVVAGGPLEVFARCKRENTPDIPARAHILFTSVVADARVGSAIGFAYPLRAVGRCVIGNNQLEIAERLAEQRIERLAKKWLSVVDKKSNTEKRR